MKQNWLIAYDITDRKRLSRAYRFLSGQALHLQNSVFIFKGTQEEAQHLFQRLIGMLDKADDLRIYPLSPHSPIYELKGSLLAEGIVLCGHIPVMSG